MFKLKKETTFIRTAHIDVPTENATRPFETHDLRCRFKVVDTDAFEQLLENEEDGADVINQVFIEPVDEIGMDGSDDPLPWNEETRALLLSKPYVRVALLRAYAEGIRGRKRKN